MTNYKVVEIFSSINGEGTRAGQLAVFVRMQGCNLNCTYCDTKWANEADAKFHWTSTEEILELLRNMETRMYFHRREHCFGRIGELLEHWARENLG
jgi:Organic radical activating enzymes